MQERFSTISGVNLSWVYRKPNTLNKRPVHERYGLRGPATYGILVKSEGAAFCDAHV